MSVQDEAKWIEAINKTGFDLEYRIQRILKHHNWHVMNNRYYVDDRAGTDREIDIVAYKVKYIENIVFYTYLIISCKKSFESNWVCFENIEIFKTARSHSYPGLNSRIKN